MSGTWAPAAPASAEQPLVCVVDDDRSMGRSLARFLRVSQWRVRCFASAEAFLSELHELQPGLLVVDIQLPGMSGLELLERLEAIQQPWPVIAMSGSNDESVERDALRLGARIFLHKPFDPQSLLTALEEMARSLDAAQRGF